MASWGQAGTGVRAAIGVGGAVAVAALTWWLSRDGTVADPPAPGAVALVSPEGIAEPAATDAPAVPVPVLVAPTLDLVRVEADGTAQVAGRAAPGARVRVQVDGVQVAEAEVAGDGAFVALFTLAPNALPSLLSLMMQTPDGAQVPGRETVALAPIAGPVVAALGAAVGAAEPLAGDPAPADAAAVAADPAALLLTEQGVAVLQAPDAVGAVSIDTIAYTDAGDVQFGGRGAEAQVVRLYLDNAALAEVAVLPGGQWGVTTPGIAPGLYTLRADLVDGAGKVTARFETPFQRETIAALAAAAAPVAETAAPVEVPQVGVGATADSAGAGADTATPGVQVAGGPAPVVAPDPLLVPAVPALPPLVSAPPVIPTAGSVATAGDGPAVPPVAGAEPAAPAVVTASPDPAASAAVTAAPAADATPAAVASPVSITVQPGLTLWAIAEANFGDGVRYVQVFEANRDKIRDPDLIYPGQVFTVPAEP